ncbi:MAG: hypothetical protein JST00_42300 [Deltaproteobacteria bacterium]|nr:hypothetical protein [Deltaproteobacteria bacterium]
MLLGAVTVIVVVSAADPRDGSTEAMERALRSAVGERATVTIKVAREGGEGDEVASAEPGAVVGVVTWHDRQRRATLHFQAGGRASDRELRFDASDAPTERGRTIGFAVASMVPEEEVERPSAKPKPEPTIAPAPLAPPPAATPAEAPSSPPRDPTTAFAIDLAASGAVGVQGYGGGMGGSLAVRVPLGSGFALRFSLAARVGEISPAQATSRAYAGAAGIAWQAWPSSSRTFGIGARADVLLLRHEVVHFSSDDPADTARARFMPGLDLLLEGGIRLADHAAVILAAGPEIALGTTKIMVRGAEVGVVPPLRLCAEGGVRVSF